ncbi:MAG: TIM barrel protein [Chthoniobacteraceae bacterium]
MPLFSRRRFLHLAGAGATLAALSPLGAIEPFNRKGGPRFRLSLAAYSFRQFFSADAPAEQKMTMQRFVDYCAEHGCDGAELTSYYFPKDVSEDELRSVRRHAFLRGVEVTGTAVGNDFTVPPGPKRDQEIASVKAWIDRAAILGAPHIRVFAGSGKGVDAAEARRLCIEALRDCCAYAGKYGIILGLENHGGIVAQPDALISIVREVESPWLGVNLDTGNFHTADPYAALAACAPYAVNVQIKTEIRAEGGKVEPADLPRLVKILRDANYQGYVVLEYEAKEDPWKAVPPILSRLKELLSGTEPKGGNAGTSLFDGKTLEGWKETNFAGGGEVSVNDGAIILEAGNDLTGVNFVKEFPKMNYELTLEAKRVVGSDFFCGLTFPVGEKSVTYVVGGWGGGVVGISSIDGMDASENETTSYEKFEADKWYKIKVRVQPALLEAWVDDNQIAKVDLEGRELSMRGGEIEQSAPIGIASFRTRAALRNIVLRNLDAQ